jgi:hypothetical protein
MVAATAEVLDAILAQGIPNRFQLRFAGKPTPAICIEWWVPVVEAILRPAYKHLKPLIKPSGPPKELLPDALDNFRNQVESLVENGDERWRTFAGKVKLTA